MLGRGEDGEKCPMVQIGLNKTVDKNAITTSVRIFFPERVKVTHRCISIIIHIKSSHSLTFSISVRD